MQKIEPILSAQAAGDPHIINFKGQRFDFIGEGGKCYNLLSAKSVQLNARMKEWDVGVTYMTEIGLTVGCKGAEYVHWHIGFDDLYQMKAMRDGQEFRMGNHRFFTGLDRPSQADYAPDKFTISTGSYLIMVMKRHSPCHFDVFVKVQDRGVLSEGVWPHGVIGQSANPSNSDPLEGSEADYEVSDLFATDFEFNRFGAPSMTRPTTGVGSQGICILFA